MLLTTESLVLCYGGTRALDNVTMGVDRGEIVAIVGPSGSGKTTLLLCLSGLIEPTSGAVSYDGQRIDVMSERARNRLRSHAFGFVFQFGDLVPELTIAENVSLPLRLQGIERRAALRRAVEQLDDFGIAGLADRRISEVSGGEMQRAAIARAVVHRPSVIFADEPTGALDESNRDVVLEQLLDAAREHGCAVVIVTHDRALAARADRAVSIAAGTAT